MSRFKEEFASLPDYLGPSDLAALGLAEEDALSLLHTAFLTGHEGRPVISADDLLDQFPPRTEPLS